MCRSFMHLHLGFDASGLPEASGHKCTSHDCIAMPVARPGSEAFLPASKDQIPQVPSLSPGWSIKLVAAYR